MKTLYVVATPIGNLGDITLRAIEVLKNVHFILAEDTRVTQKLLRKYDIKTQMVSYRDQNHEKLIAKIREKLDMGLDLALVSDAGTPGISDPGFKLVSDLKKILHKGYEIITVPGPCAAIAAMSVSGLATDKFSFLGFLPKSSGKRHDLLSKYMQLEASLIIYESPARILKLIDEVAEIDENREISVASELTKLNERVITGSISDVKMRLLETENTGGLKGEFVIIIQKEL